MGSKFKPGRRNADRFVKKVRSANDARRWELKHNGKDRRGSPAQSQPDA